MSDPLMQQCCNRRSDHGHANDSRLTVPILHSNYSIAEGVPELADALKESPAVTKRGASTSIPEVTGLPAMETLVSVASALVGVFVCRVSNGAPASAVHGRAWQRSPGRHTAKADIFMNLLGPLTTRPPGPDLTIGRQVERHRVADEISQGRHINLLPFMNVDGSPDIPVKAGVE